MAPESRPPLSHPRPPLATRLRKSFEGKRSKSEATGINGYAVQDPDALQSAVDQAINSEAFQNAIAANLAKLIKPSIKSALDTIQPVVEAVYSHDVLLRKTNKSVEDILDRMDSIPEEGHEDGRAHSPRERSASAGSFYDLEFKALLEKSNKRTVATLAELSNAVQSNNSKVAGMEALLGDTKGSVEYLKAYLQNQLDQLQADMGRILDTMESDKATRDRTAPDTSLFSSHTTKLDTISTDLAGLKGFSRTSEHLGSISADLNALKASVEAGITSNSEGFTEIGSKLTTVTTTIQAQDATLEEIKQLNNTPEIMAAVQKSNASHESHTLVLGEIKERSLIDRSPAVDASTSETATTLQELKSDLALLKENIEARLTSNNENVTGLETKLSAVVSIQAHKAMEKNAEVLAAVQKSNDSHASHSSALDGIKSLVVVPAPTTDTGNLVALESQIGSIINTLDSHTTSLDEIKAANSSSPSDDTLTADISSIATTLDSHTKLLNEIKDDVSAEILTALHDVGQTQTSHTAALSEIREADVSDEILTALHTSIEAHTNHESALEKLHLAVQTSNDSHEKHEMSLGEIKSRSLEPAPTAESSSLGDLETKVGGIVSTLEEQNATLLAIKDSTIASVESHAAHALSLSEIKEATTASKDFHMSHATTLSEIKDASVASKELHSAHSATLADLIIATGASNEAHGSHSAILSELKSSQPSESATEIPGLVALETDIKTIISTLESQTSALSDIKDASMNPDILTAVKQSHELLTSHTSVLDSIKEGSSHEDILANISSLKAIVEETKSSIDTHSTLVKDLHSETKDSHSSLATTVSALALGGAAGAGAGMLASKDDDDSISAELLHEVKAVRQIVEKSSASTETTKESVTSIAAQIEINHTTVTTSITTLSDELKAEVDASSTDIVDSVTRLGTEVKGVSVEVNGISGEVKAVGEKFEVLGGGVHFSEKGVAQLKEHSLSIGVMEAGGSEQLKIVAPTGDEHVTQSAVIEVEEVNEKEAVPVAEPEPTLEPESTVQSEPAAEEPVAEPVAEPIAEELAADEPVAEEPTAEEPAADEPIADEPTAEEPVADEPVAEEPVADEPVAEEPAADEPVADEPIAEEPVAEPEPVVDEEPASAAEPEPVAEEESVSVAEPAPAVEEEPVPVAEPAPAAEEEPEPVAEPIAEPIADEPVAEPVAEPIAEAEPVFEVKEPEAGVVAQEEPVGKDKEPEADAVPDSEPAPPQVEHATGEESENPIPEVAAAAEGEPISPETIQKEIPISEAVPEEEIIAPAEEAPTSEDPVIEKAPILKEENVSESELVEDQDPITEAVEESSIADATPAKGPEEETLPPPQINTDEDDLKSPSIPEGTELESEPTSELASPVTPTFPEGESSNGKKGKKGKKEKGGKKGKKEKKEKVPFELEGEEPVETNV